MGYKQNNPFSRNSYESPLNSFDSLVAKLMKQGKSKESATKIAGSVANAKMHGAGSGPTAKQKARHGMSRESSELKDMPVVDIEKGDAKGDKGVSRRSQGYNDRLDESLAKDGKESTKKQSMKARRDESKGMKKSTRKGAYSSDPKMS